MPHGRAFRVLQPKAFEERVIPLFFRHGRYASFARQVNGWGFHRITNGPDYGSYYHELFLRGLPHLCEQMRRPQPGGPRKSRKEISSEPSPNFYEISEKASLPELPPREPSSFGSLAPPSMHNPPRLADAAISNNGLSGAGPVVGAMVEGNSRTENLNAASPTAQRYNAASSAAFAGMGMGGMGSITGIGGMGVAIPGFCAGLSHHSAHPVAGAAMLAGAVGPSAGLPGGAASAAPLLLQGMGSAGAPTTGLPQQFHGIGAAASLMPNIFGMGGIGQANLFGASGLLPGQQQQGQQMVSNGNGQGAGYLQLPDGGTSGP
uniref:HSF-type DNA-binding domain-containing protein n=1 Tax=Trieres chinensis TaxID=1514140 RepID=A0A7S1Z737_TRICV